jgi:hypothetical protein
MLIQQRARFIPRPMRRALVRSALALFAALAFGGAVHPLGAQQAAGQPGDTPPPAANPTDVASIDAIIAALYDVISGPAGEKRDWDRFYSLFANGARLIPTGRTAQGEARYRVWTPEEYVVAAGASLERDGFFEREIGFTQQRFGNVVHRMSAYDSKRRESDPAPFARGINSIQLWNDGTRWFVVTVFWEAETPANPIPAEYLRAP